jgi:hypothetical protein
MLGAAPGAQATSLLVPGDISPGYYWATPTESVDGYIAVCADYTCDVGRGMIQNYTVNGRTMISVPNGAMMVNVERAELIPAQAQPPAVPPAVPRDPADLNVSVPMSHPPCDGAGIVVLGNAVTPGQYAEDVQRLLDTFPGSSYLRTDESCPSLRHASDAGNPIYAVYRVAGRTYDDICAAVHAAGGGAYGRVLSTTLPLNFPCG